jgi:hypothetical protein
MSTFQKKFIQYTEHALENVFRNNLNDWATFPMGKRDRGVQLQWGSPVLTVRLESEPGSQPQAEFSYVSMVSESLMDKRRRSNTRGNGLSVSLTVPPAV